MIPDRIRNLLLKIQAAGYEAYLVGGCVRDLQLGRPVHDWDVTTSARPETVMAIFDRTIPTGLQHGTVTVVEDGMSAEVTTYRQDGIYENGRSPKQVVFIPSLTEDLSRRDFTINAMAMDVEGTLIDLHGGCSDLETGCIRCVGDPTRRFEEDALRMLRAVRFSAQLGFTIEENTLAAIQTCADRCSLLSAERIREELEKTLCSFQPERVGQMIELGLLRHLGAYAMADPDTLRQTACEPVCRWAMLFYLCPQLHPEVLRLDKRTRKTAIAAAAAYSPHMTILEMKRLIVRSGLSTAHCVAGMNRQRELLNTILQSGECVDKAQLAVTGRELFWLRGEELGEMLKKLLEHVLEVPEDNQLERLLELAKKK